MALIPFNSVGGYSTGITGTAVIDANGNITGVGATFSSLVRFNAGISSAGATLSANTIIPSGSTLTVNGNFVANGNVNLGDATTDSITVAGLLSANSGISAAGGTFSGTQTFVNGATFQGNIVAPNIVTSFNGSTGAIVGVNSVRGLTGAVGITNGSGIGLSVSGQTMTFSNTGVLSFNNLTGDVTGVTTGTANTFVALQSFTTGISASGGVTFSGNVAMTSTSYHTV